MRQLFYGGTWRAPAKGGRFPVVCPATEEVIGSIPAATAEDVNAAVEAAVAAVKAKQWTASTGAARAAVLRAIAEKVQLLQCGRLLGDALLRMPCCALPRCFVDAEITGMAPEFGTHFHAPTLLAQPPPLPPPPPPFSHPCCRSRRRRACWLGWRRWTWGNLLQRQSGTWTMWRGASSTTQVQLLLWGFPVSLQASTAVGLWIDVAGLRVGPAWLLMMLSIALYIAAAGLAEQLDERQGEPVDLGSDDFQCRLRRDPLGVVGLISPWNYPRECLICVQVWRACGCTRCRHLLEVQAGEEKMQLSGPSPHTHPPPPLQC